MSKSQILTQYSSTWNVIILFDQIVSGEDIVLWRCEPSVCCCFVSASVLRLCVVCRDQTADNYRGTASGFVQLYFGHSVQHKRDGRSGQSTEGLHSCVCTHTHMPNVYHMQQHTHTHMQIPSRYVWIQFYPNSLSHKDARSAGCLLYTHSLRHKHIWNTRRWGFNQQKETHTFSDRGLLTQSVLVLSAT